jgi:tRNA pseudouridine38-40 synthase
MEHRFAWHIGDALDLTVMRQAAVELIGRHDFKSFQTATTGAEVNTTVRTVFAIEIRLNPERIVTIDVVGDGFLRYMVRTIVGTLVEVGLGRREANDMSDVLLAKSRDLAGPTAPALGLCLVSVDYSDTC